MPARLLPSNEVRFPSGLYVPVNGAAPVAMSAVASSSSSVLVKLSPMPPTSVNSSTRVPSGATRNTSRSSSQVWLILINTFKSRIVPALATVRLELNVPGSGILEFWVFRNVVVNTSLSALVADTSVGSMPL